MCSFCNNEQMIYDGGYISCPICSEANNICYVCGGFLEYWENHEECLEQQEYEERHQVFNDFIYPGVLLLNEAFRYSRITALGISLQ